MASSSRQEGHSRSSANVLLPGKAQEHQNHGHPARSPLVPWSIRWSQYATAITRQSDFEVHSAGVVDDNWRQRSA